MIKIVNGKCLGFLRSIYKLNNIKQRRNQDLIKRLKWRALQQQSTVKAYFYEHLQGLFQKLRATSGRYKKGHFFTTKQLKRAPLVGPPPYVLSFFTVVLIKQIFEKKKKLSRAGSKSRTQFSRKITPLFCRTSANCCPGSVSNFKVC